jgi:hypothetical protein
MQPECAHQPGARGRQPPCTKGVEGTITCQTPFFFLKCHNGHKGKCWVSHKRAKLRACQMRAFCITARVHQRATTVHCPRRAHSGGCGQSHLRPTLCAAIEPHCVNLARLTQGNETRIQLPWLTHTDVWAICAAVRAQTNMKMIWCVYTMTRDCIETSSVG